MRRHPADTPLHDLVLKRGQEDLLSGGDRGELLMEGAEEAVEPPRAPADFGRHGGERAWREGVGSVDRAE